ncbi:hypothetical protein ACM66B_006303 [Microbotryomycetes sp. NB124-2]
MQEQSGAVPPSLFRSLVFGGHVTCKVQIAQDELPTHAERAIDSYFVQAPRISYLPLLVPQLRKHFLALILDSVSLNALRDDSVWFSFEGAPLKWHWPIGLLYDLHVLAQTPQRSDGPKKSDTATFVVTLHIKNPPADALLLSPSTEACQSSFMNMLKESDYTRYGSTKRIVNLRREQQDAVWEGVVQSDFEKYWNVASKLISLPMTTASHPPSPNPSSLQPSPPMTRSPSPAGFESSVATGARLRSVPLRIYLPDGAPVMQELAPPLSKEGLALTHVQHLTTVVPLLFPSDRKPLARVIVQGIQVPLEAEIGWLGSCLVGADGWVSVVVAIG